jgi:hypothetical protein
MVYCNRRGQPNLWIFVVEHQIRASADGFKPRIRTEPFSFKTRKKNLLEKSEMSEVTLFSLRLCGTRKCCLRARWNKVCAGEPFLLSACFAIEEARFSRGERPKVQTRRKEVPSRSHPTGAAREKSPARLARLVGNLSPTGTLCL